VQHERESLGRTERLEHDLKRKADRVGDQRLVLGSVRLLERDDRLGQRAVEQLLVAGAPRTKHVETHPADDHGQPRAHVVCLLRPGAVEPQPGLLHRVVGLGDRAEHAVGDGPQVVTVSLELFGRTHWSRPLVGIRLQRRRIERDKRDHRRQFRCTP